MFRMLFFFMISSFLLLIVILVLDYLLNRMWLLDLIEGVISLFEFLCVLVLIEMILFLVGFFFVLLGMIRLFLVFLFDWMWWIRMWLCSGVKVMWIFWCYRLLYVVGIWVWWVLVLEYLGSMFFVVNVVGLEKLLGNLFDCVWWVWLGKFWL